MSSNKLKVQAFRANDLSGDTGKQFEFGRSWCDFLEIDNSVGDITFNLLFKPLSKAHENLKDHKIELQLSALTIRNDRKAYANGAKSGHSAIKEFFLEDLHLTSKNNSSDYFAIYKASEHDYYLYYIPQLLHDNFIRFFESITPKVTISRSNEIKTEKTQTLQQIFYGAPGTGKSHEINRLTEGEKVIRTTFHPDSDYSTFVGAYKPIMKEVDVQVVPVVVDSGISLKPNGTYKEKRITYQFVKQAFLKAYLGAWKKYADSCSICCTPAVHEFDTGNGRYVINSVGVYELTLSREFLFSKKLVMNEWQNLWNNGVFEVPTGQQSGKSVQHAIANWIFDKIDACTEDKFEEGWQKLVDTVREKRHVDVQKTQTYIISGVTDDNEKLTINVEARGKKRATLQRKFNGSDKTNTSKLEKTLIDILKNYSNDFDDAWELLKHDVDKGTSPEVKDESIGQIDPQFLVIEEINRGNCAQIFGDIFQLLDRDDNGFSVYPIEADSDLRDAIKIAFEEEDEYLLPNDIDIDGAIEYTSNYGATLSEDVQSGRVLLFPPNLYIWATMNTSDQSLFPIDSAFKRRWDWKYMKIKDEHKEWKVDVDLKSKDDNGNETTSKVNWWEFVDKINKIIASMTSSADKQLGYFFCKATEKETGKNEPTIITKDTFVSKVIFYLWNDVFKDYGFDDASLFRYKEIDSKTGKEEEKDLTFPDFYDKAGENVNSVRLTDFITKVMNWKKPNEENK